MKKNLTKVLVTASLIASLILGSSNAFALTSSTSTSVTKKTYTGYLIDADCGSKGYDSYHKLNIAKNPEKHLTECLKMDMCMMSGLGISVKGSDGKYKYYKFDAKGSKMADDKIMMMTKRKINNKITVTGTVKNGVMTITSIKEAK